jgi:transposase
LDVRVWALYSAGKNIVTIDEQIAELDQAIAEELRPFHEAVQRLAEVPGYGVDSAQQVVAEVGPQAATFPSAHRGLLG